MTIASTIDRLAADVATIKAKVDAISPEDVAHFVECEKAWVSLAERQRDEAIRKRDEALAEVERLRGELAARPAEADTKSSFVSSWILRRNAVKGSDWSGNGCPACGGSMRIWFRGFHDWTCLCAWPEKRAWWKDTNAVDEDWLNELVWRWKIDAANSPKIPDSSPAASQPIADAIDRLAADVAEVKEATCGRSGWPVGWLIEVDRLNHRRQEAIALADAAQGEVERLKRDGIQAPDDLGILRDAHGLSDRCRELASRIAMQQIEARAERVKAELEQQPPAAPQPAAQPAGWLTEEERRVLRDLLDVKWADVFERVPAALLSILARAGSPPVVVLPTVFQHSSLGDKLVALQQVKDSLVAAGIAWKEVGRE